MGHIDIMAKASFQTRLTNYLDAGYALLAIETHEELRALSEIRAVVGQRKVVYAEWTFTTGLTVMVLNADGGVESVRDPQKGTQEPVAAFKALGTVSASAYVVIFKDLHPYLGQPGVWRTIRDLIGTLREAGHTWIFLSPRSNIPPELNKEIQLLDFDLPSRDDLKHSFDQFIEQSVKPNLAAEQAVDLVPGYPDSVAEAAMGMTAAEADNAYSLATIAMKRQGAVTFNGKFLECVFEEKIVTLKASALEYVPQKFGFESIGGMDLLKGWAIARRQGFEESARKIRLPYPRGVLLSGVRGTGKSICAMALAKEFGFPLFKFDIGKLYDSKVGSSEALTREVIKIMDGLGRAVILLDEIDKSLNTGSTAGTGDSGVSSRMFGLLLSWMSFKTCPVFLVGTLNNFEAIPPELLRPGRFDAVFWIDLPTENERRAIFEVLLKTKYSPEGWNGTVPEAWISGTRDFTGAEIEAAIQEALYASLRHIDGQEDVPFNSLMLEACANITPQAQLNVAQMAVMKEKAKVFKPASSTVNDKPVALPETRKKRSISLN